MGRGQTGQPVAPARVGDTLPVVQLPGREEVGLADTVSPPPATVVDVTREDVDVARARTTAPRAPVRLGAGGPTEGAIGSHLGRYVVLS